ncbi:MAG: hypothetical protein ABR990_13570 [Terracidiphilus sp.]|jgi:hypothetical protein
MKHVFRLEVIVFFAALLSAPAFAQTAAPPPPKPAGSGPSLEVTMQFLQEKLSDIGKVTFLSYTQNTRNGSNTSETDSIEVSNVAVNANQCHITYHWKVIMDGRLDQDKNSGIPLRDVQDVVIKPYAQYQTELDASLGNPHILTPSTNPPLSALLVRRAHGVYNLFPIADADTADRIAKAMVHAVELCGGGNKTPF